MTGAAPETAIRCVIIGAGGHASVLLDALAATGVTPAGVLDAEPAMWGTMWNGTLVLGGDGILASLTSRGITHFIVGVGGIGDNRRRVELFDKALAAGLMPLDVVHPASVISPRATVGSGCQILPGAIVNAGAHLGSNVIVNTGAIVEHDSRIADHVHVATGARLASTVTIGRAAHIGAGAVVLQRRSVGEWAVVGAGAVVVRDVPPGTVVVGVPAKPLEKRG
jgi:sugar O-acyltransferase (sialic acid O-acetyltransferase NeuD family)